MSKGPLMTTRLLAERMGIKDIHGEDGYRLAPQNIEISTAQGDAVNVTVKYMMFGPAPKPAASEQAGGYWVPDDCGEAVRSALPMVTQRAAQIGPDLTDWIDGSVEPTIVGVYERNFPPTSRIVPAYSLWDGASWHSMHADVQKANRERALSSCQNAPWRGLRHDPARSEGHGS